MDATSSRAEQAKGIEDAVPQGVSDIDAAGTIPNTDTPDVPAEVLTEIIHRYPPVQRHALAIMQDMQHRFDYLPRVGLELLADYMGCPIVQLYSMATFYKALSLKPKGRHIIRVCDGTACHIKASLNLIDGIERQLGIRPGDVTPDGQFSLETVNCLGSCALAPVLLVGTTLFGKVTLEKLPGIIDSFKEGGGSND